MSVKFRLIGGVVSVALFAICCLVVAFFSDALTSPLAIQLLLGLWGVTALTGPVLLIAGARKALEQKTRSRLADAINRWFKIG